MSHDPAEIKARMQDVLYGALLHDRYDTSEEALIALLPLVDQYVAEELRRIADDANRRFPHLPPYGLAVSSLELLNRAAELDGGAR